MAIIFKVLWVFVVTAGRAIRGAEVQDAHVTADKVIASIADDLKQLEDHLPPPS